MADHGDYDSKEQKWYCGYWMNEEEWLDIHDYAPFAVQNYNEKQLLVPPKEDEEDNDD